MGGRGGSSGVSANKSIKGNVSFAEIIRASDNSISFSKIVTVLPSGRMPQEGKKGDLETLVNRNGINDVVVHMYRNKAGENDLKRMQSIGFETVAQYKGKPSGSRPAEDYYYMKRKKKK